MCLSKQLKVFPLVKNGVRLITNKQFQPNLSKDLKVRFSFEFNQYDATLNVI